MFKTKYIATAMACLCTAVLATDINLLVQTAGGHPSVTVSPGEVVDYRVVGILSDGLNEGLALIGFDLTFTGGALSQADEPSGVLSCANPMVNFVKPDGITNPAGYGGTEIGGNLVQIGGGQNTINNTADNADFPVGSVLTGVAKPSPSGCGQAVVVTGSLTAPLAEGQYILSIPSNSVFANVIRQGETGAVFWATEAAGVGAIGNLTINVSESSAPCGIVSAFPPNCAIDARYANHPADAGILFGWDSVEMQMNLDCDTGTLTAVDFSVSSSSGVAPTIVDVIPSGDSVTLSLSGRIPPQAWTCFGINGTEHCLGFLPGDANGDRTAAPADILTVIDNLNGVIVPALEVWQCDVDRSGVCAPADILAVIDILNGAGALNVGLNTTLPVCPSAP